MNKIEYLCQYLTIQLPYFSSRSTSVGTNRLESVPPIDPQNQFPWAVSLPPMYNKNLLCRSKGPNWTPRPIHRRTPTLARIKLRGNQTFQYPCSCRIYYKTLNSPPAPFRHPAPTPYLWIFNVSPVTLPLKLASIDT